MKINDKINVILFEILTNIWYTNNIENREKREVIIYGKKENINRR